MKAINFENEIKRSIFTRRRSAAQVMAQALLVAFIVLLSAATLVSTFGVFK
jgi:hypothetical protein